MDAAILYPNCDFGIWFRSVNENNTTAEPIEGKTTGVIPDWINGCLYQNGPGVLDATGQRVHHLFDAFSLIQKFTINHGHVTYQNRILQSKAYQEAVRTGRSCYSEYGTPKHRDSSHSADDKYIPESSLGRFVSRVQHFFHHKNDMRTDNAMISIYPYRIHDDQVALFAMTEAPVMHEIDAETLETRSKFNVSEHLPIVCHCAHGVVLDDGTILNVGLSSSLTGMHYALFQFPGHGEPDPDGNMMQQCKILARIPSRWMFNPSYMHTFAVTPNYIVLVEQSLCVSLAQLLQVAITHGPLTSALIWHGNEPVRFRLIHRHSMTEYTECVYLTSAFFFLHIINAYEDDEHLVVDICCYENADMLHCMTFEMLEKAQTNPDFARQFFGRPKRFVLPLRANRHGASTLGLSYSTCEIRRMDAKKFWIEPELIVDVGCELPQIDYFRNFGKFYRFFYAINSDIEHEHCGAIRKIDVLSKTSHTWHEDHCYTSEPIFLRDPANENADEDEGVLVMSLLRSHREHEVSFLVLNARDMTEVGRVEFIGNGPVPKSLHCLWVDGHTK